MFLEPVKSLSTRLIVSVVVWPWTESLTTRLEGLNSVAQTVARVFWPQLRHQTLPPNNSFKPTPLRGAA